MRGPSSFFSVKVILTLFVSLSLLSLGGPLSSDLGLSQVQLVKANLQNCQTHGSSGACSEFWYPAGPAMNFEQAQIFSDQTAELNSLQSASPTIDSTDSPLPNSLLSTFNQSPNFLTSAPIVTNVDGIEFMMANSFWGVNFNYGNNPNGVQIRQGIAHMIDKNSFTTNDAFIGGHSTPIDNPEPPNNGLLTPNPCVWDASFPESGPQCVVSASANGGVAFHLQPSGSGANGILWLAGPGSQDLNAAAQHFVNAGVATGFSPTTSVLTGISSTASQNVPEFFIRNDNPALQDLGTGLAEEICYLFTGSYNTPCTYLHTLLGPISAFPGFATSTTGVNLNWWIYTGGFVVDAGEGGSPDHGGPFFEDPFDATLYFGFNSRFVSGIPSIKTPSGSCASTSLPTSNAANYEYNCNASYDGLSTQMETAPCLTAQGDPIAGASSNLPTSPGNGICPGFTQLSSISAGIQTESNFGQNVYALPVFSRTEQFGYLNNGWTRMVNDPDLGIPNFFTTFNAYNPSPPASGTFRQGLSQTTHSVNPYIASTIQDGMIVGNVYDALYATNPLGGGTLNWMTISTFQLSNSSLAYSAPPHTLTTYRFTLQDDVYFQDGQPVTSYDIAFSYLSMEGTGALAGVGASLMTGITVLSPSQLDIGVNTLGPFTLVSLTSVLVVPGRYWVSPGSQFSTHEDACLKSPCGTSQYTLVGNIPQCTGQCSVSAGSGGDMQWNTQETSLATFDPTLNGNGILIGSGPWKCVSSLGVLGQACSSTQSQNPGAGGSYTLQRFGKGISSCQVSSCYFRSSSNAALWIWSEQGGANSFLNFEGVASCYGQPVNLSGPCAHWQQGIGNPGTGSQVTSSQVTIANRFYALNWVAPFDWATNPPIGIAPFPPVLYEGTTTLSPASIVGCPTGYDC